MITTFYNEERSFINAMQYVARKGTKEEARKDVEAWIKARKLAPYFNSYIDLMEIRLGKKAKDFTEEERSLTSKEFMEIYSNAESLLK
ncbi:MAG: hypothetical protein ACRDB0_06535 [Paraclostridium sp.]